MLGSELQVDTKIRLRLCPNRSVSLGSPAEELQKVLLEQIDFRRRLEQEFHALKGTSPFPVFRELCYCCFHFSFSVYSLA